MPYLNVERTTLTRRPAKIQLPNNPTLTQKFADRCGEMPRDGIILCPSLYYLPFQFNSAAVLAALTVRKANRMRAAWYSVPAYSVSEQIDGPGVPLPAYGTLRTQLKLLDGTIVLGLSYQEFVSATGAPKEPTSVTISVTDACTGVSLTSDFADANLYSRWGSGAGTRGELPYVPLPQPRLINGDGRLDIEVHNNQQQTLVADPTLVFQLTLWVAEPAALVQSPTELGEGQ